MKAFLMSLFVVIPFGWVWWAKDKGVADTPKILKKRTNDLGKFGCNPGHNKLGRLLHRHYLTADDCKLPYFTESQDPLTSKSPPAK